MDCRAHFVRCLGFPYRSALTLVWLRQYSLRASLPGGSPVRKSAAMTNVKRHCECLKGTKQSSQLTLHVSIDCRALVPRARNDVFSPRHCEGVRRTTEAIQSANAACFYGLPCGALSAAKIFLPNCDS